MEEGNSLTTQERICKEYALKYGYEIAHIFIEQGESAKTADRTELKKLLDFCAHRKKEIAAVIAYKIDRISRNTDDYSQIRLLLKQYKVEIKSTSEQFEDTPVGKFLENTMANIAQFDNDIRTERSVNGMKEAMRDGRYVWHAPFGYENVRIGGRATIRPHPIESNLIQKAFNEVAKNISPTDQIRRELQKQGLSVSKAQFYNLLKNEIYVGWIKKFKERHKGLFEPLINQETFGRVQYILIGKARKNYHYQTKNPDFPLRRFIYQPGGKKLTGAWAKGRISKHAYYRFLSPNRYFQKDVLENIFKTALDHFSLNEKHNKTFVKFLQQNLIKKAGDKHKEAERIKNFIQDLQIKKNTLVEKNLSGVISDTILQEQLAFIEKEISDNKQFLSEEPKDIKNLESLINIAELFLKNPSIIWQNAPFASKILLQWFVFPSGICLDEMNLRTKEICNLFKLKEAILPWKSYLVPLSAQITNGGKKSHKHSEYYLKLPQITLSEEQVEELLPSIEKELLSLKEIMEHRESF